MPPPHGERSPLWPPLFLLAALAVVAYEARAAAVLVATLASLLLLPLAWRVLTRRWRPGDVVRGLAVGFIACHLPLLVGALQAVLQQECRSGRMCWAVLLSHASLIPWAGLLGALLYWARGPVRPR